MRRLAECEAVAGFIAVATDRRISQGSGRDVNHRRPRIIAAIAALVWTALCVAGSVTPTGPTGPVPVASSTDPIAAAYAETFRTKAWEALDKGLWSKALRYGLLAARIEPVGRDDAHVLLGALALHEWHPQEIPCECDEYTKVSLSRDNTRLVYYSSSARSVHYLSLPDGREIGHKEFGTNVSDVTLSSNGSTAVATLMGTDAPTFTVWSLDSGSNILSDTFPDSGHNASFSLMGNRILLASVNEVHVWDVASRKRIFAQKATDKILEAATLSPDGTKIALRDGKITTVIRLSDAPHALFTKKGNEEIIDGLLTFSDDGATLIDTFGGLSSQSGNDGHVVRLWNVKSGAVIANFRHADSVLAAALTNGGNVLASASANTDRLNMHTGAFTVHLWSIDDRVETQRLDSDESCIRLVPSAPEKWSTWSEMRNCIGLATIDRRAGLTVERRAGAIVIVPVPALNELSRRDFGMPVRQIDYSLSGAALVAVMGDGKVWVADRNGSSKVVVSPRTKADEAHLSDDSRRLVTLAEGGDVELWDATNGTHLAAINLACSERYETAFAKFSADSTKLLIACSKDASEITLLDATSGGVLAQFGDDPRTRVMEFGGGAIVSNDTVRLSSATMSRDGSLVAAHGMALGYHRLLVWDVSTKKILLNVPSEGGSHRNIDFSPDGRSIVIDNEAEGSASIWDVVHAREVLKMPHSAAHSSDHELIAWFSPDGRRVFVPGGVWDVNERHRLGNADYDSAVLLTAAGDVASSWGRLVDVRSGSTIVEFQTGFSPDEVASSSFIHTPLAISHDGSVIAAGVGNAVVEWSIADLTHDSKVLAASLCAPTYGISTKFTTQEVHDDPLLDAVFLHGDDQRDVCEAPKMH